jgi:hypothetical protein
MHRIVKDIVARVSDYVQNSEGHGGLGFCYCAEYKGQDEVGQDFRPPP